MQPHSPPHLHQAVFLVGNHHGVVIYHLYMQHDRGGSDRRLQRQV